MATYVVLFNWTEEGIKNYKDSTSRAEAARTQWGEAGIQIKDLFWTIGPYDIVGVVEAPDDETLTGALLVLDETQGIVVALHKASFLVWVGATGVHVLAHALRLPALVRRRIPGAALRLALVAGAVVAGSVLAIATLPGADRLQDRASAPIGLDAR